MDELVDNVLGVRVFPALIQFTDVQVGRSYSASLSIQNISHKAQTIKIQGLQDPQFTLTVETPVKPIAPGLQVTAMVKYQPTQKMDIRDRILILVDKDVINVPVLGVTPSCYLEIDPVVNFGCVIANSKVISKEIRIMNIGSSPGSFKIKYDGFLPITIAPNKGTVKPKTTKMITLEFCTDKPGIIDELAKVKLQGRDEIKLPIKGNIVHQVLELLDMSGKTLDCVKFGATYFGTSKSYQAVLFNNSPEEMSWVSVLDDNSVGVEIGTDLQKTTDAALQCTAYRKITDETDADSLISCLPNQGVLLPYEKTNCTISFSPKKVNEDLKSDDFSSKQDYALFMRFEPVGSKACFLQSESNYRMTNKGKKYVELAITGCAIPVAFSVSTGTVYNFKECLIGERIDIPCSLKNESQFLPVVFSFRKITHFHISPAKGNLQPGHSQDVMFSFVPHQIGSFKVKQVLNIMDPTSENNLPSLKMKTLQKKQLTFMAVCKPVAKKIVMKLNPGITPLVSNATGRYVQSADQGTSLYTGSSRVSTLNAAKTQIHDHEMKTDANKGALIAFPNDRAASIRPSDHQTNYRTIFTKVERYSYVDPDYTYNEWEESQKKAHKDYYDSYIKSRREKRLERGKEREFKEVNNATDIGITPAAGLHSPRVLVTESQGPKTAPQKKEQMLTTSQRAHEEARSLTKEGSDGLNAVPCTAAEKEACSLSLTPQQLYHVVIGPSAVDFGEVCVGSISMKEISIINRLPTSIWVQVEIDCEELQQTSPLSHVMPPMSQTEIPVVFETSSLGTFKKSITYTVNNKHAGYILITAKAVPVALELSSHELVLRPNHKFLVETGFRSSVRLYNNRNHLAEFSWKPIISEKGTAFSIRPARGIVDALKDLECEVVWHPGFNSPDVGEFSLCVQQGNTLTLKCIAELGSTSVQFTEQRVLFHKAPLGLTTSKAAIIKNTGMNHAYFQVVDISPLPAMVITPSQGIVPAGGHVALQIFFTPRAVMKFDTRVEVSVRNTKPLELRIRGSAVPPEIDISVSSFLFPGVYVNSTQVIPFELQNKGVARAKVEFDLSKYSDFSISFKDKTVVHGDPMYPHVYTVDIEEKECLQCSLDFNPTELAAYDFQLPININFAGSLSLDDSSVPVTPTSSEKHIVVPRPQMVNVITPSCRVNATALVQLVRLSRNKLEFEQQYGVLNLGISESQSTQRIELTNLSKQIVTWKLNLDEVATILEDGVFRFFKRSGTLQPGQVNYINVSFCPPGPGNYVAEIPLVLNNNPDNHLPPLHLFGRAKSPKLVFDPPFVILTPVPLDTEAQATVNISPIDFFRECEIKVEIPKVKLESGDWIQPFSLDFPNGQIIGSSGDTSEKLICNIIFQSPRPVSCLVEVLFIDEHKNQYSLQVAAVAENCILTVYPHLAFHLTDQQINLRSGHNGKSFSLGDAVLRPCYIPETPPRTTSASSLGMVTCSTYEGSLLEPLSEILMNGESERTQHQRTKDAFELSFFPNEESDEGLFFQRVLTAVQIWFSLFGWPSGCNPISIPQSLWSAVCKFQKLKAKTKNLGKETKTIYDMLFYLSGQMLPGISESQPLPSDPTERVLQLHWQHSTMLTFLKSQGAFLPHIKPEFLFEPLDYERWMRVQKVGPVNNDLLHIDSSAFLSVSKRAWTDVLLQTYKVLVLSRVSLKTSSSDYVGGSMPRMSSEPFSSNIYSTSERILLTWLNVNYEKMRQVTWKDCQKGGIPATRWIINFDKDLLDGLVLSSQVAAYCPHLISTHFICMYTNPERPEECLHNCLILVNALHAINLDIDIQATDICDPNPVMMLMLCVYLHEKLTFYLPKKTIMFDGALYARVKRQVRVKNPSSEPLLYNATFVGRESADFSLPKGNTITIAPKSEVLLTVEYTRRFLHPAEATLLLISQSVGGAGGTTMAFSLQSQVTSIVPTGTCKKKSPCYELTKINLNVKSPYNGHGKFRVILVESVSYPCSPDQLKQISQIKQNAIHSADFLEHNLSKVMCETSSQDKLLTQEYQYSLLRQFFCPVKDIFLQEGIASSLQAHFLPFDLENRYCMVILSNEKIGDFIYMIEGISLPPLPLALTPVDGQKNVQIDSAGPGYTKKQKAMHLNCSHGSVLKAKLKIPLVNGARENALATAAQLQMTSLEYERRKVTGTLQSSTIRAAVASVGLTRAEVNTTFNTLDKPGSSPAFSSCSKKLKMIDYDVKISMPDHFEIPKNICIPVSAKTRLTTKHVSIKEDYPVNEQENGVFLPVTFFSGKPGRYPCKILLRSSHDVRVYMIVCVVNPTTTNTELEFITPACAPVIQDIPIINKTQEEWKLHAVLKGDFFYGPPYLNVLPGETALYPLTFKPVSQCTCRGKLILQNETDCTEYIFGLRGIGQEPVALRHVVIDCQVKKMKQHVLMVPNYTKKILTLQVISDLTIISGPKTITIKPGISEPYYFNVSPWKRGSFQGMISFVVEDEGQQQLQHGNSPRHTVGGNYIRRLAVEPHVPDTGRRSSPYKVWFSLTINSKPAPPERTIHVTCAVLETVGIDIPISNPLNDILPLHVLVNGAGLSGNTSFTLQRKETFPYMVKYSPSKTGIDYGSVIFQSEVCGEFWYELKLKSEKRSPVTLTTLRCELGKWIRLAIPLRNPTAETLELEAINSNPEHFLVEVDPVKPILVPPHSTNEVTVQFCPSVFGKGTHKASITFKNPQVEEWIFHLSGIGLVPQPMESTSISSCVGIISSVTIPFKNPTDEHVLIDVILTDQEQTMHRLSASVLRNSIRKKPAFCLPLKKTKGIPLAPKERFDFPVLFAPETMKLYEALVVVHMVKANGKTWDKNTLEEPDTEFKSITRTKDGAISGIRWIYPVHGIPEARSSKSSPAVVCCQARTRTEEKVEVLLTGVVPGQTAMPVTTSSVKQTESVTQVQEEVQVSNGFSTTEEFFYEISYESKYVKSQVEPSVIIELVKKERDVPSGIVTLMFNIIFAPTRAMRHSATLVVKCATGGIWKFPIQLVATEPDVDDVIKIEAIGLNKESYVGFRLTSQTRYPEPFNAYFLAGSDKAFSVYPKTGELLPFRTAGTLMSVGFKPTSYGKKYKATLVVQTSTMQWTYEVNGLNPKTRPLTNVCPKICTLGINRQSPAQRRNYIHENLKRAMTAISPVNICF
ncbi:LOW QUALITY PROTEIN: cilia- and flagella-associated protein 47 [Pelodytes ibericus]